MNAVTPLRAAGPQLALRFGIRFEDLHSNEGLARLDLLFLDYLGGRDAALRAQLINARHAPDALARKAESELLIVLAGQLEAFLAQLFDLEAEVRALSKRHLQLAPLYRCKRQFVQRKAMIAHKTEEATRFDGAALEHLLVKWFAEPFSELAFASHVQDWQKDETANPEKLDCAMRYAAWAAHTPAGRARHAAGVLFKAPRKLDYHHLVPTETRQQDGVIVHHLSHLRRRSGFALTDPGTDLVGALDQAHYCIFCHEQGKDSCSHGLKEKSGAFKNTIFGVPLAGCPLEERISEFHKLKTEGFAIGALAMICVDNPMVAATGHRICNDCMKSCIYQKQEPVNIPQAETRTLKDVLALPWGFEIYSLLTRWNPLDLRRPLPKPASGRRVLIAGMGPAGFTLAHFLLNDGHTVIGVDGLKIEPLPAALSGVTERGERVAFAPVFDVNEMYESLDSRLMAGFGGVAEYGITVRWDKNYLKVIRLLLERRAEFAMFGGVRFGSS
ncbi:MAG: hypothetical protein ACREUQ_10280, partial [Burkholderiales bacterium]